MDTASLILVHAVLASGSIRGAARLCQRPPASISAALDRAEAELSVPLTEKAGTGLVLTLEAARLKPKLAELAHLAESLDALRTDQSPRSGVSLATLARFCAVAEAGSIRRAAQNLRLGQPQLTRQIAGLEVTIGAPLLSRSIGGSTLTPIGETVHDLALRLGDLWDRLTHAAPDRHRRSAATARLGSVIPLGYESEIARLLAELTVAWRQSRPRQPLFVSSTTAEDLMVGLRAGRFDAALLDTQTIPPGLEGQLLSRSPLALVGAPEKLSTLQPGDRAGLAALLTSTPIALPSLRSGLRQAAIALFDDNLTAAERDALDIVEIDSIPVIINLVMQHGFISVMPDASIATIRADLGRLPLGAAHQMTLWLVWPPATRALGQTAAALLATSSSPSHPASADAALPRRQSPGRAPVPR